MRTTRALGLTAVLATAALVVPGGASAAPPTTVSGTFDDTVTVDYVRCTTDTPTDYASGTWSVTLNSASTAKGTFTMDLNGEPHVAYTYPGMKQAPGNTQTSWSVYGKTVAGLLTVTVTGGDMDYRISPYNYNGLSCQSATFHGLVDRD